MANTIGSVIGLVTAGLAIYFVVRVILCPKPPNPKNPPR